MPCVADKTEHRFYLAFTCFTCDRSFNDYITLACPFTSPDIRSLKTFVCRQCKDKDHGGVVFIRCRSGSHDAWNSSGYHDFSYTSQVYLENVDT